MARTHTRDRAPLQLVEVAVFGFTGASSSIEAPAQLATKSSEPFVYATSVVLENGPRVGSRYCALARNNKEASPASAVRGNQYPAIFQCSAGFNAQKAPVQIDEKEYMSSTSVLFYNDHNDNNNGQEPDSVKIEGWRQGYGARSVLNSPAGHSTLTYGVTTTSAKSCVGLGASCRQMHGPFAGDTTTAVSKEWSNLPKHSSARISARIWAAQSWDNEKAVVEVSEGLRSEEAIGWEYIGCWRDNFRRQLPLKRGGYGSSYEADCSAKCSGFAYFGLQWHGECWCGDDYNRLKLGKLPDRRCECVNRRGGGCKGTLYRGQGWSNAVYRQVQNDPSVGAIRTIEAWSKRWSWRQAHTDRVQAPWLRMRGEPVWGPWRARCTSSNPATG